VNLKKKENKRQKQSTIAGSQGKHGHASCEARSCKEHAGSAHWEAWACSAWNASAAGKQIKSRHEHGRACRAQPRSVSELGFLCFTKLS